MKNINKKFSCNGNVDVIAYDKELIKLSKEAGCVSWLIGFESISQDALDEIGKKTNKVKEYKKAVENIHNNGMIVIGCFIFGFDNDNKDVFKKTLKMINELNIDVADFLILTPFPGTPLYDKLQKEGRILTKDWSKYNMKNVVFYPKNMSSKELFEGVRNLYKDFYSYKSTIKRVFRSIKFGIYPCLLVLERNFTAHMNSRKFLKSNKKY